MIRQGTWALLAFLVAAWPALAQTTAKPTTDKDESKEPPDSRGEGKIAKPASVSVTATPLGSGNIKVTFEFYQEGTGRLKSVSCSGTPKDIEEEAKKVLPSRVQGLAKKALERI